jgi:dihydrofolate reductase
MAKLIYSALTSLDGYIEDADGRFDWARPDPEVHAFINERLQAVPIHMYGRRMYEVMKVWEAPQPPDAPATMRDFAASWQAADKVVYSRTLAAVETERTRIVRDFVPAAVRQLKARAQGDLLVGGAELAGRALAAGLVDEVHLYLAQIIVGGGKRALPDGVRLELALVDERRFAGGMVYLRYARRA